MDPREGWRWKTFLPLVIARHEATQRQKVWERTARPEMVVATQEANNHFGARPNKLKYFAQY